MLINTQKDLKPNEIYLIKLTNGEEVMARVAEIDDNKIMLENPQRVVMTQNGPAIMPFTLLGREETSYVIYKSHIIGHIVPSNDAELQYIKTTTGIELPR